MRPSSWLALTLMLGFVFAQPALAWKLKFLPGKTAPAQPSTASEKALEDADAPGNVPKIPQKSVPAKPEIDLDSDENLFKSPEPPAPAKSRIKTPAKTKAKTQPLPTGNDSAKATPAITGADQPEELGGQPGAAVTPKDSLTEEQKRKIPPRMQNLLLNQMRKKEKEASNPNQVADTYQTDNSKNFSYILPPGWKVTKNPMVAHDILVKDSSNGKGNIIITDKSAKGGLSKISEDVVHDLPKQCDDFKLIANEKIKLGSGVICERLVHTGKITNIEICQANYLMPYINGQILIVTGTFTKDDTEGLATLERFATSMRISKKRLTL